MIRVAILVVLLSFCYGVNGQELRLSSERDSENNVIIYGENPTSSVYTVVLDLEDYSNLKPSTSLPAIVTVRRGKSKLLSLSRVRENSSDGYQYSYRYFKGEIKRKLNEVPYGLPFPEGVKGRAFMAGHFDELLKDKERPDDFYVVGFHFDEETPVLAPRRGIVMDVVGDETSILGNLIYSRTANSVEILHDDGTFTVISVLKSGSVKVRPGQEVNVGDEIALCGGENYNSGYQIRLYTSQLYKKSREELAYKSLYIKFLDAEKGVVSLKSNEVYHPVFPESLITKEMSKKEVKRWRKSQE